MHERGYRCGSYEKSCGSVGPAGCPRGRPLPEGLDDDELARRLHPRPDASAASRPRPDWASVHQELKRPGVTLLLLWIEHLEAHPDGYRYSRFCERYRRWARALNPTMRQRHRAGEKTS